jgi:PKD repeat protein
LLKLRLLAALLIVVLLGFHASSNQSPQARFTYYLPSEESELTVNTVVTFDGSGSVDPDGRIVSYEWDFDGDGIYDLASDSPTAEWLYDEAGDYQASLRVTDNDGATATGVREIEVADAPVAVRQTISTPMAPNRALPGDWIEVRVEIHVHGVVNGLGLQAELPEGWRLREVDSDGATFKRSGNQWLWVQGLLSGDRLEVTYEVRVPEDAARGLYRIGGLVSSFSPRFKIPIPKDVEVQVI